MSNYQPPFITATLHCRGHFMTKYHRRTIIVSNSLILESCKARVLRPELESLTNFGSIVTFSAQNFAENTVRIIAIFVLGSRLN